MRPVPSSKPRPLHCTASALASVVAGVALAMSGSGALAQQRTAASQPVSQQVFAAQAHLERAFWLCDYAASGRSIANVDAMACSAITEELRLMKFRGDFDAMLAWWQQGRGAAHAMVEASVTTIGAR